MGLFSRKKVDSQTPKTKDFQEISESNESQPTIDKTVDGQLAVFDPNHRTHFEPTSYDETGDIADTLIRFKEVMISFKNVADKGERRRIIDFLTGVMYALSGSYKKIDDGIFYFWIKKN